jgi:mono/diheme cytochrome c family protein
MFSNCKSQTFLAILFTCTSFAAAAKNSEQLFLENCAECHQSDGKGLTNIYPALAGSEVVKGSGVDVALVLIIGRGEMPSFSSSLSNEDMAMIINYVRNAWGNSGDSISAEVINSLKK